MPAILYGNMKGGVGKTTNSVMTAYQLAKLGYKTLVCDLDPQANATQLLRRTYGLQHGTDLQIDKTMMVALTEENIKSAIVNIMDNLYLLPSSEDFKNYP
ncbi:AAA family ATPase, partial [Lactobacillus crispatus]